jgi:hypothetical protein
MSDPLETVGIPIRTPVIAYNGDTLKQIRNVHPNFILVSATRAVQPTLDLLRWEERLGS